MNKGLVMALPIGLLLVSSTALAQLGPASSAPYEVTIGGRATTDTSVSNREGSLDTNSGSADVTARVYKGAVWSFSLGAHALTRDIDADVPMVTSGALVPERLYDLSLTGTVSRNFGHRFASLSVTGSHKTDELFEGTSELGADVTATLVIPRSRSHSWLFFANYSNQRSFLNNIPIPGVALIYHPSAALQVTFGLPFVAANWRPTPKIQIEGSFFPVALGHLKGSYHIGPSWSLYSLLESREENYQLQDRMAEDDRLFYSEAFAGGGMKAGLGAGFALDARVGYGFARRLFHGEDFFSWNDDPIKLDGGATGLLQLSWSAK